MPKTIVFDLGGVLVDWNPRYVYRQLFDDETEMEAFLSQVCSPEWNVAQDAGRTVTEAVAEATSRHPEKAALIEAYYERFDEMMAGPIDGTVEILARLHQLQTPCYALTNWSAETFPLARNRFEFMGWFKDIVVSGEEKLIKPDPAIYRLLLERFALEPQDTVFIDDSPRNVQAAAELGLHAVHFTSPSALNDELARLHLG